MSEMVVEQDRGWEGSHPCWNTECPTYGVAKIAPFFKAATGSELP